MNEIQNYDQDFLLKILGADIIERKEGISMDRNSLSVEVKVRREAWKKVKDEYPMTSIDISIS